MTTKRSFLAGLLPLSFALSQSQLRLVSTVGMGVLVGTSLIVIIPEGVETLYSANKVTQSHSRRETEHAVLHARWRNDELFQTTRSPQPPRIKRSDNGVIDAINSAPGPVLLPGSKTEPYSKHDPPLTPTNPGEVGILGAAEVTTPQNESIDQVSRTPHAWIGISLILGFILMYLIDKLPSLPSVLTQRTSNVYSLSDLGSTNLPFSSLSSSKGTFSTTLGLVIHSAADGIALGATSAQPSLSLIIFVAIMVHKAPAAFGLTSTLLRQGLGKRPARVHLLVFSLAAPIGAICTWLVVHILGGGGAIGSEASMRWWTGVLLLFSGGTFL